jgi:crossover junction endodeoxyribonuclease RuvC
MNRPATSKRVLGVDPGFDRLGLAVLEGDPSRPAHIWSDCILPPKGAAFERLAAVHAAIATAIDEHQPDVVAIETLFFSTNKKTALAVAEARGAVLAACGAAPCPVIEFSPAQVKLAVAGYGSADKKAIALMVPRLVALPAKKRLDDELDAIAVAIAGLSTRS